MTIEPSPSPSITVNDATLATQHSDAHNFTTSPTHTFDSAYETHTPPPPPPPPPLVSLSPAIETTFSNPSPSLTSPLNYSLHLTLNSPLSPKFSMILSNIRPCQLSMMPWLRMEPRNLFHQILLTISLVASGCFTLNVYLMALLIGIKLVLLQKVFISILAWTILTPLVRLSSRPLYTSFSILR